MNHNTIPGSNRQTAVSRTGTNLERGYCYLQKGTWDKLYAAASAAKVSASVYIERLINADCGNQKGKTNGSSALTRSA